MGSKGSVEGRAERITEPVIGRVKTLNRFRADGSPNEPSGVG